MQDEYHFIRTLLFICKTLNNRKVRYLIVGGAAVNSHGHYRPTTDRNGNPVDSPDFDVWFNPTFPNYMRLLDAFDDFGFETERFREDPHPFPRSSFFRFKPEGYSLDFLPRLGENFLFSECYSRRLVASVEGVEISVIGLDDLIAAKAPPDAKKM